LTGWGTVSLQFCSQVVVRALCSRHGNVLRLAYSCIAIISRTSVRMRHSAQCRPGCGIGGLAWYGKILLSAHEIDFDLDSSNLCSTLIRYNTTRTHKTRMHLIPMFWLEHIGCKQQGPPRVGSGPCETIFGPRSKGEPAKNQNTCNMIGPWPLSDCRAPVICTAPPSCRHCKHLKVWPAPPLPRSKSFLWHDSCMYRHFGGPNCTVSHIYRHNV
jgi:hypothetical protein